MSKHLAIEFNVQKQLGNNCSDHYHIYLTYIFFFIGNLNKINFIVICSMLLFLKALNIVDNQVTITRAECLDENNPVQFQCNGIGAATIVWTNHNGT